MNAFIDNLVDSDAVVVGVCVERIDPAQLPRLTDVCVGFTLEKTWRQTVKGERIWVMSQRPSTAIITAPLFLVGEKYLLLLRQNRETKANAATLQLENCFELVEIDAAVLLKGKHEGGSFDLRLLRDAGISPLEQPDAFVEAVDLLCRYLAADREEKGRIEMSIERSSNPFSPWLQRQIALYAARAHTG